MADRKISELSALTGANSADDDVLVIVDTSADETKKITLGELENALAERDFSFGDNDKLVFGAGSDLQIYHDGTNSIIRDGGTGILRFQGNGPYTEFMNGGATETLARLNNNGSVDLFYDNSKKFATTSTGVDITGTLTSDGLTVDGDATVNSNNINISGTAPKLNLMESDTTDLNAQITTTGGGMLFRTLVDSKVSATTRMKIGHTTGDISFYEDTGTTAKFFWDASAELLKIGSVQTVGTYPLIVKSNASNHGIHIEEASGSEGYTLGVNADGDLGFYNSGSSTASVVINDSGNVGIGTNSPSVLLDLDAGSSTGTHFQITTSGSGHNFDMVDGGATARIRNVGGILRIGADHNDEAASSAVTFQVDGSEAMRIDSSGNVGIGTDSPNAQLDIESSTQAVLRLNHTTSNYWELQNDSNLKFNRGGTERMRIDSSGNVGIGTTSPSNTLHVKSSNPNIRLEDSDGASNIYSQVLSDGSGSLYLRADTGGNGSSSKMQFDVDGTERMRIDSSGNLLVGKTVASSNNIGFEAKPTGFMAATRDGNTVAVLNRKSSDGTILDFRKDGTNVGSIGISNADFYIGKDAVGIAFDATGDDGVRPWNPSTNSFRDNAIDLGGSAGRFKNLYLSGGVYLGGTGSANYLDDYEEGTWTVGFHDASSGGNSSSTTSNGRYTKIGRLVHVTIYVSNLDSTGLTSGASVYYDLPFSVTEQFCSGSMVSDNYTFTNSRTMLTARTAGTSGSRGLFRQSGSGVNDAAGVWSGVSDGVTDFFISMTYLTAA